jgi:hypothetical protein
VKRVSRYRLQGTGSVYHDHATCNKQPEYSK